MTSALKVAIVGNPNCGKSTVFNALTGARQKIGNWPGVTVERKSGFFNYNEQIVEVVDLPGTYSLTTLSATASIDERIVCEFILNQEAQVIVNVLDASNLERSLYLTLQLIEMQVPIILAVNMMDVAQQRNLNIDLDKLSEFFKCPVIALEAHKQKGIADLKQLMCQFDPKPASFEVSYPDLINRVIQDVSAQLTTMIHDGSEQSTAKNQRINSPSASTMNYPTRFLALRLLEEDVFVQQLVAAEILAQIPLLQKQIREQLNEDSDILLADARYQCIGKAMAYSVKKGEQRTTLTNTLDKIVLNRFLGIPIFLGVMYCMFLFSINIGAAFQEFFNVTSTTIFVDGLSQGLNELGAPAWLIALLADGAGKGISTTLTFIPVIGTMFLFLSFLEDSGYMARAAFVVDRLMRALGLPGKSFVPMIVGFGCNVPAIMGARTLENQRDRILTVMMSPFMSCGARLAIFAVFVSAFFPAGGQNVVFGLYLTGIVIAMLTGLLLRKTILKGEPAPLLMELPAYHIPSVKTLSLNAWQRLKTFVIKAGKLIVPVCVLVGALGSITLSGASNEGDAQSILAVTGRAITPLFAPMGIENDNWPATVGLLTGVLAKEVVVGTLNTLYTQMGQFGDLASEGFDFWGNIKAAALSIPTNLSNLSGAFGNPVVATAPIQELSQNVYGLMAQRFDGKVGAIAYLLFILLYVPCVSTTAAVMRELNKGWAAFSVVWSTAVAYGVAVSFYQLATFDRHPLQSLTWVCGFLLVFLLTVFSMRIYATQKYTLRGQYELT